MYFALTTSLCSLVRYFGPCRTSMIEVFAIIQLTTKTRYPLSYEIPS